VAAAIVAEIVAITSKSESTPTTSQRAPGTPGGSLT
jgi:hypothetical protein